MIWWMKKNLIVIVAAFAAFFMALAKAFTFGKASEQKKQTENTLKVATTRLEIENEVNGKNDTDVRTELSHWLRDK
ncbi:hypothetical protein [Bartonella doshiae]|uniref:Uncharacterized protein n=2 Tax=Bartonella doshiae TaxID=33044 RepID=A0A380ZG89_BARDO|nr:hypothetical protein [Bartonella doshiae]EJF80052.1 hypothetical protein MCS_01247 [Bartonella doshiae NCTC 12862 = ATCC 700133]MBB6158907.1 putative membrane protein [Bartonella doshiae]SUV45580.1 Uncharacterised protein [Bartonella doshiae]